MKTGLGPYSEVGHIVNNFVKSIVTAIPGKSFYIKPESKVFIKRRELTYKDHRKAFDIPLYAKPLFERQLLIKEKKKK
ncbi:MAG: hypothetical protein JXB49_09035 [Bacteroidales bacterium]|nr:hypothetical protein [Bacteroidales bacterium]